MFEVSYSKEAEKVKDEQPEDDWNPLPCNTSVECCHGEHLVDPTYVLGVGATIKVEDIPEGAKEIYVFYHFTPGQDVDD